MDGYEGGEGKGRDAPGYTVTGRRHGALRWRTNEKSAPSELVLLAQLADDPYLHTPMESPAELGPKQSPQALRPSHNLELRVGRRPSMRDAYLGPETLLPTNGRVTQLRSGGPKSSAHPRGGEARFVGGALCRFAFFAVHPERGIPPHLSLLSFEPSSRAGSRRGPSGRRNQEHRASLGHPLLLHGHPV